MKNIQKFKIGIYRGAIQNTAHTYVILAPFFLSVQIAQLKDRVRANDVHAAFRLNRFIEIHRRIFFFKIL